MKALIPYAILGAIGTAGAVAGVAGVAPATTPTTTPAPQAPTTTPDGAVLIHASLDRTALPVGGGDVYARIALEGVVPQEQATARVPVSLTLVIDRSGSMGSGSKMRDAQRAAADAIAALRSGDQVCVISFDDGAEDHGCASIDGQPSSSASRQLGAIERLHARGGTDMIAGLDVGGRAAQRIHGAQRVNRLLLLSDGRPNTEAGLREQVAALAKSGVQTTTLGLGADYNEDLMASLADHGLGKYYFVENGAQLAGIFAEELRSLAAVVAREATIELQPKNGARIVEVIGFLSHRNGENVSVPAGDIYGGRTTDILVKLSVPAGVKGLRDVVNAKVAYTNAKTAKRAGDDRLLAALFTEDTQQITQSIVPVVAAKAEKAQAAAAWVSANEAFNRGDKAQGDAILRATSARLREKSKELNDKDLAVEAEETDEYQARNESGGAGWRASGSKAAKKKAWSMNKGSAY